MLFFNMWFCLFIKNLPHMYSLRNLPYLGLMSDRICTVDSRNWEGLKSPVKGGVIFPSTAKDRATFKNGKSERKDLNLSKAQFSGRGNIFVCTKK